MTSEKPSIDALIDQLRARELPGLGRSLEVLGVRLSPPPVDNAGWRVGLPVACEGLWPAIGAALSEVAQSHGAPDLRFDLHTDIPAFGVQRNLKRLPGINNIVAVSSGKGGVGKSSVAVNLALAWQAEGGRVGILDADIYGPSVPRMLGLPEQPPESIDGKQFRPVEAYGLQAMSIGLLLEGDAPAVWRGPMATSALNQLLRQTAWHELDVLIIDLPPGTGDIQLSLAQTAPVAGAIVVTTPQDVALSDARKGLEMFRKVSVPILGVVENMSLYRCPECGHESSLFGQGGGHKLAADAQIRMLGELPLDPAIGHGLDRGRPTLADDPDSPLALAFRQIAISGGLALAEGRKDYSMVFPKIVVEDT
ncbi:MAG: iron-sulfur cluster carrier protein ApbC [Pseudomonadota bacterium]